MNTGTKFRATVARRIASCRKQLNIPQELTIQWQNLMVQVQGKTQKCD